MSTNNTVEEERIVLPQQLKMMLKGTLLYTTFIVCMVSVMGIDDIYDKGYFFADIALCAVLIYACYKTISEEELDILSLNKYFGGNQEEDDEW